MANLKESELKSLKAKLQDEQSKLRQAENMMSEAEDAIHEIEQEIEALENNRTPGEVLENSLPLHLALKGYILIETKTKERVLENKDGDIIKTWRWMPSVTDLMEIK